MMWCLRNAVLMLLLLLYAAGCEHSQMPQRNDQERVAQGQQFSVALQSLALSTGMAVLQQSVAMLPPQSDVMDGADANLSEISPEDLRGFAISFDGNTLPLGQGRATVSGELLFEEPRPAYSMDPVVNAVQVQEASGSVLVAVREQPMTLSVRGRSVQVMMEGKLLHSLSGTRSISGNENAGARITDDLMLVMGSRGVSFTGEVRGYVSNMRVIAKVSGNPSEGWEARDCRGTINFMVDGTVGSCTVSADCQECMAPTSAWSRPDHRR